MSGYMSEEFLDVLHSLYATNEDAVVLADMKNVFERFSKLSEYLPFGKFLCATNSFPHSSFLFHILETLGFSFSVNSKDDIRFLDSVELASSRQWISNSFIASRLFQDAKEKGITNIPVSGYHQLQRLTNMERSSMGILIEIDVQTEGSLQLFLRKGVELLKNCWRENFKVTGFIFNGNLDESCLSHSDIMSLSRTLNCIARKCFGNNIEAVLFGPNFLKSGSDECLVMIKKAFGETSSWSNINIYFDVTNFLFINGFKLWARVQGKHKLNFSNLRRYTVSEGVFSVFNNLLSMEDDDLKPSVVAYSRSNGCLENLKKSKLLFRSTIVGPSGDNDIDILVNDCSLPDLDPFIDWLVIDFGAVVPSGLANSPSDPLLYMVN